MKGALGTIVGGAIGAVALFVVGKIAFQAGYDIAETECRYEMLKNELDGKSEEHEDDAEKDDISEEKPKEVVLKKRGGMLGGIGKLFGLRGGSVLGNLLRDPENHVIEARVKGREIHVNVRPKGA